MSPTRSMITVAALLLWVAAPANAQDEPRFDFGLSTGGFLGSSILGADDAGGDAGARFEPGWVTGGQFGIRVGPRVGLRANVGYSERPVESTDGGGLLARDVNLWSISADALYRLREPGADDGADWRPFLAAGVGVKRVDPAAELVPDDADLDGVSFTLNGRHFLVDEASKFMGLLSAGTDAVLARGFMLRFELATRAYRSPTAQISQRSRAATITDPDANRLALEVSGQVGAHVRFGFPQQPVVAAAPPPDPEPEPEPEPEPREERVRVCVIDPANAEGLRSIDAVYVPATRDTLFMEGARRTSLRRAFADVPVASGASWFVSGEPLVLGSETDAVEFLSFGAPRAQAPGDVRLVGTARGLPLYAPADRARAIVSAGERSGLPGPAELERLLEESTELIDALDATETLYVPSDPVGCIFQPLERVERVKKVRG